MMATRGIDVGSGSSHGEEGVRVVQHRMLRYAMGIVTLKADAAPLTTSLLLSI
jgi:hypothetical protein